MHAGVVQGDIHPILVLEDLDQALHEWVLALTATEFANLLNQVAGILPRQVWHVRSFTDAFVAMTIGTEKAGFLAGFNGYFEGSGIGLYGLDAILQA